ncbi:STAS domain-containing protein [Actinosynnema sp. CS-041913]|uniref:STAS domain-containing protein n=1 Tax=Actinosynnema sp. CS-041913 TaxID=3239917 RepID=UPI003D918A3E
MNTGFAASARTTGSGPVLTFTGELDASTAPAAHDAVQHLALHAGDQLVLDLAGLLYCDSSGITTLIAARERALTTGAGFALAGVPPHLTRTLGLLGLTAVFLAYRTTDQAHEAWATAPNAER